ncbi:MAG: hypothetical protein P8Y42_07920 [Exilibacterium sp.]
MGNKPKLRNRHAAHPIMRKGGVHEKSRSAKRREAKRETRRAIENWRHSSPVDVQHKSCIEQLAA